MKKNDFEYSVQTYISTFGRVRFMAVALNKEEGTSYFIDKEGCVSEDTFFYFKTFKKALRAIEKFDGDQLEYKRSEKITIQ